MKTPSLDSLIETLFQSNLTCGDIRCAVDTAEIVLDYEREHGLELSPEQVLMAVREAAERFVDAMQENARDTWESEQRSPSKYSRYESEADYDLDIARWEAKRPSVIRRAQLQDFLRKF